MKKILVIDDSSFVAVEVKSHVKDKGYEVIGHAKNGEDGIEKYKELKPDIVTLDIIMPGIDGIETAEELLKINPDVKIIMLSSLYDYDILKEIETLGLTQMVAKPIEKEQLLNALHEVCPVDEEEA